MAVSLISRRLLEVISNRSAGNGRSPGKSPFSDFQSYYHEYEAGSARWTSRMPHPRPTEPTLSRGMARRVDHPQQGLADKLFASPLRPRNRFAPGRFVTSPVADGWSLPLQ